MQLGFCFLWTKYNLTVSTRIVIAILLYAYGLTARFVIISKNGASSFERFKLFIYYTQWTSGGTWIDDVSKWGGEETKSSEYRNWPKTVPEKT